MTPEQKAAFEHSLIRVPENTFPAHEAGLERAIIQQDFLSGAHWQRENGWILVEDKLPEIDETVFVWHSNRVLEAEYQGKDADGNNVFDFDYYQSTSSDIKLWHPYLPTPPKTKEDGTSQEH